MSVFNKGPHKNGFNDSRWEGSRGEGSRVQGSRGEGSRTEGSRGERSRGERSRGEWSRGEGSRGEGSRRDGSRRKGSRGEGSRREGSRGQGSRGVWFGWVGSRVVVPTGMVVSWSSRFLTFFPSQQEAPTDDQQDSDSLGSFLCTFWGFVSWVSWVHKGYLDIWKTKGLVSFHWNRFTARSVSYRLNSSFV